MIASERPYIGELSSTLPPPASRMRTTSRNATNSVEPSTTSKPIQVPQPITGSICFVDGTGRRFIAADEEVSTVRPRALGVTNVAPANARARRRKRARPG